MGDSPFDLDLSFLSTNLTVAMIVYWLSDSFQKCCQTGKTMGKTFTSF